MAEALNGSFKAELVHLHGPWRTRHQLEVAHHRVDRLVQRQPASFRNRRYPAVRARGPLVRFHAVGHHQAEGARTR